MRNRYSQGRRGRPIGVAAALTLLLGFAAVGVPYAAFARALPTTFADLTERLLPSVVNISTTQTIKSSGNGLGGTPDRPRFPPGSPFEEFFREFFDREHRRGAPERKATSLGSGFVVDAAGLIVTNNHVIAEADEITVTFADETRLPARVVGRDAKTDLALLRVKPEKPLTVASFGDSDAVRVGDWVLVIGNPFGLGGTVTAGIVSARHRDINAGPYDDFIQTDASINRGNSGGPMFNLRGEVVGVSTAIFSPTGASVGIGFAIPASLAEPIVGQLEKYGKARRGWLGVRIQTVSDEIAQGLGLKRASGALVASLSKDSPAERGGIAVGDVILAFDGLPIGQMRRLPRVVAQTPVGKPVDVVVWRKGARKTLRIELGEFPEDEKTLAARTPDGSKPDDSVEVLGLKLSTVTEDLRKRFNLGEDVHGVIVTEVEADSPAADKHIRPGDIIRRVGPAQSKVASPAEVKTQIDRARESPMRTVLVLLEREGSQRFVAIGLAKG